MAYIEQLYADIRTVVGATWADVLANGIWENEHEQMVPWAELTPPYATICIPDTAMAPDWGVANQIYSPPVSIYYVGLVTGDGNTIRAKLESLRDALLANTVPGTLCVLDVTALTWTDELEANKIFMAKDYAHRAGRLTVSVLAGTMAT